MDQLTICLIIFVLTVISYCVGKISMASTSIVSLLLLSLTGCLSADEAVAYFGDGTVVMIGGMCVVAAGFNRTQFCDTIAQALSRRAKGNMTAILGGYVILGIILSQFIQSPVAVFGIVAPMLASSARAAGISPSKVMFSLGVAVVATCCTLPVGAGATVAAEFNGYLESYGYTAFTAGLADAALGRTPLLILCALYCIFLAPKFAPEKPVVETKEAAAKSGTKAPLSPFAERAGYIIFILVALGLTFAKQLGLDNWQVTVIGAMLMVLCGVLKPKEATEALPMSMLLLIVGALGMADALAATGAGDLIGGYMADLYGAVNGNSYIMGAVFFIVPFLMTQVMQNRATMMIFHPIAIATCASVGGNPIGLMILIQAGCLTAFMTPMATAAIPYMMDYGGYDQPIMFKMSWRPAILFTVVAVAWVMTIFPIL